MRRIVRVGESGGRVLRRHALRWWEGRVCVPRGLGTGLAVGLLGATGAYGAAAGGHAAPWSDAVAAGAGFAIAEVRLSGATETPEGQIAAAVGLVDARSLVGIDVAAARVALTGLPWIATARVRKELPGTLVIEIEERRAVARWMLGERTFLIDADGEPIVEADGRVLPLVVGRGAGTALGEALALRTAVEAVTPEIKALVRVGQRRWDLVTHRNVVVMLPEREPHRALARLANVDASQDLLDKDVEAIDLRVADRLTIRLADEVAQRRADAVKAGEKVRKKTRKDRQVSL